MKEFFVGLMVIVMLGVLSILGILLFPLFLVMGLFLKLITGFFLVLFVIWLIGKITLVVIEYIRNQENGKP